MKVRMTTDRAGLNFMQSDGEIHDLPEAEARALIVANQADPVEEVRTPPTQTKRTKR